MLHSGAKQAKRRHILRQVDDDWERRSDSSECQSEDEDEEAEDLHVSEEDEDSHAAEDTSANWEVAKILDHRGTEGNWEYLVSWKGFSDDESTWEPEESFEKPRLMIRQYWADIFCRSDSEEESGQANRSSQPPAGASSSSTRPRANSH